MDRLVELFSCRLALRLSGSGQVSIVAENAAPPIARMSDIIPIEFFKRIHPAVREMGRYVRHQRVWNKDAEDASALSGRYAVRRVLEGNRFIRCDAELLESKEIQRRIGLDSCDVVSGADGIESIEDSEFSQTSAHPPPGGARRNRDLQAATFRS